MGVIQRKVGNETAKLLAQHNSLVQVISAALGNGESNKAPPPKAGDPGVKDLGAAGQGSVEDAVAAINKGMLF